MSQHYNCRCKVVYERSLITPNAKRCLRQTRGYLWHAWESFKAAIRWQVRGY